jgi:hypothetical protein
MEKFEHCAAISHSATGKVNWVSGAVDANFVSPKRPFISVSSAVRLLDHPQRAHASGASQELPSPPPPPACLYVSAHIMAQERLSAFDL